MNLGQFLSQYSPLPSATVVQHLLAIAENATGQGETVFASRFCVSVAEPLVSVVESTRRCVGTAHSDEKLAYPKLETLELVVTQSRQQVVSEQQFDDVVIQRRSPSPKVIER